MVSGSVPRRCEGTDDGVAELDDLTVREHCMFELHAGADGQVGGRSGGLDQRGEPRDVIGLDVRLEHGRDRSARALGRLEVALDELDVRIDHSEGPA
jgi:hypothetical protein